MVTVTAKLNTEKNKRCPMCMDDIDGEQIYCPHLGSLIHEECMAEFGRCGCLTAELRNKKLIIDLGTIAISDDQVLHSSHTWPYYFARVSIRLAKWTVIMLWSPSHWFTAGLLMAELLEFKYRKR